MLVNVRYTSSGWVVDENTANLIPEFRAVIAEKSLGISAMAFIALAIDPTSFLSQISDDEDVRIPQAYTSVYEAVLPKAFLKNKVISPAIDKYRDLCDTDSIKLRKQYRGAIKKVGEFLETEGKKLDLDKFAAYITALAKLPAQIKEFEQMGREDAHDIENVKKIIRGDRELTFLEKRQSAKRKNK